MKIAILPALADNYIYVLESGTAIAVVDPGETKPVTDWAAQTGKRPTQILLTHHHGDHVGGAEELRQLYGATIIGAAADEYRLPPLDQAVQPGDTITVGNETATIIDVPGHTVGHIVYCFENIRQAFVGDTLFSLGCGRLFEGTPEMMHTSLQAIAALPAETKLYCGHEYTAANARFALSIDPGNPVIRQIASRPIPTMPAILANELAANPFLRCAEPAIAAALGLPDAMPAEVFTELRKRKDHYR